MSKIIENCVKNYQMLPNNGQKWPFMVYLFLRNFTLYYRITSFGSGTVYTIFSIKMCRIKFSTN